MSNEPEKPEEDTPPSAPEEAPTAAEETPPAAPEPAPAAPSGQKSDKKLIAGLLGILLGSLGIHKFYLGYQTEGIIMLVVTIVAGGFTCGAGAGIMGIVGLIEGILYLTKTDAEFDATYVQNKKAWF